MSTHVHPIKQLDGWDQDRAAAMSYEGGISSPTGDGEDCAEHQVHPSAGVVWVGGLVLVGLLGFLAQIGLSPEYDQKKPGRIGQTGPNST